MDIQRHPRSVVKLAEEIKKVIDAYWSRDVSEEQMREYVLYFAKYEKKKLFRANEYSPTIKQRVGKKRLEVINKVLEGYQMKF